MEFEGNPRADVCEPYGLEQAENLIKVQGPVWEMGGKTQLYRSPSGRSLEGISGNVSVWEAVSLE